MIEGLRMNQSRDHQIGHLVYTLHPSALAGDADQLPAVFTNAAALSGHLQSDLTCNVSNYRKRNRDETVINMEVPIYQQLCFLNSSTSTQIMNDPAVSARGFPCSAGLSFPMFDSAASSSSDQPASISTPYTTSVFPELSYLFHQQDSEIRSLLRHQIETLRWQMVEAQKKYCKVLLSTVGQHAVKKLREKEAELENASKKNAELEEKVRQMTAESLIWFNLAKSTEALVSSLRTSLEQAMIQNAAAIALPPATEGFGDTDGSPFLADDAHSCCFENNEPMVPRGEMNTTGTPASGNHRCRMACKVCRENEASVLVLPCKHLCLCKACVVGVQTCPVCRFHKNASLQILMS